MDRQVHRSLEKPAASGPACRISRNCNACEVYNRRVADGRGFRASAARPPCWKAFFQRLTLERLICNRSAIAFWVVPSWSNSTATRRRTIQSSGVREALMHNTTVLAILLVQTVRREELPSGRLAVAYLGFVPFCSSSASPAFNPRTSSSSA